MLVLRFGPLNPPLDLADVVEILAQPRAVARAQPALQVLACLRVIGVEDAAVPLHARQRAAPAFPARPNSRSNTTRGLISIGSGVVGDAHEIVFMYAQL